MFYIIKFKEDERINQLIVEPYNLMPGMLELKKRGVQLLEVEDEDEKKYTIEELCKKEKRRVDKLYAVRKTKEEIFITTKNYFNKLLKMNLVYKKDYDDYMKQLEEYMRESKTVDEFREKAKTLYMIKPN